MTASNHTLTGVLIGLAVPVPLVALPLAFASHFALDALPHYEMLDFESKNSQAKFKWILLADAAVMASILLFIILSQPAHWPLLIACGLLAASPDLMWLPGYISLQTGGVYQNKIYRSKLGQFHTKLGKYANPKGWMFEAPYFLVALGLLITNLHG